MLFLEKLKQRKKYILISTIIFILIGITYAIFFMPKNYMVSSTMLLLKKENIESIIENNGNIELTDNMLSTFEEIIKSESTVKEAIYNSNVKIDANNLNISINRVLNSDTFEIKIKNINYDNSLEFANKIISIFKDRIESMYSNIEVYTVNSAHVVQSNYINNIILSTSISLLIGILINIAYLYFGSYAEKKIKIKSGIKNNNSIKTLISIPLKNSKFNNINSELYIHENDKSLLKKAFRDLRANIQFINVNNKDRSTILITSPKDEEGKSFIAANIAISFIEIDKKVIIIDADLNKGRQAQIFNIPNNLGLSNFLSNLDYDGLELNNNINNFIRETEIKNLSLITSGTVPPNSYELLASPKLEELIKELNKYYDIIVIDGTSVLTTTDSLILTRVVGSTILVSLNNIKEKEIQTAKKDLQNVGGRIIGIILNKVKTKQKIRETQKSKINEKIKENFIKKIKLFINNIKSRKNTKLLLNESQKEDYNVQDINIQEQDKEPSEIQKDDESDIDEQELKQEEIEEDVELLSEKNDFVEIDEDNILNNLKNEEIMTSEFKQKIKNNIFNMLKNKSLKKANEYIQEKKELSYTYSIGDTEKQQEVQYYLEEEKNDFYDDDVDEQMGYYIEEDKQNIEYKSEHEKNGDIVFYSEEEKQEEIENNFEEEEQEEIENDFEKEKQEEIENDTEEEEQEKIENDFEEEKQEEIENDTEEKEQEKIENDFEEEKQEEKENNIEEDKKEIAKENVNKPNNFYNNAKNILENAKENIEKISKKSRNNFKNAVNKSTEIIEKISEKNKYKNKELKKESSNIIQINKKQEVDNSNVVLVIVDLENGCCRAFNKDCYAEKLIRGIDENDRFIKAHYSFYLSRRRMESLMLLYSVTKLQAKRVDPLIYSTLTSYDEGIWIDKKNVSNKAEEYAFCMMKEYERLEGESSRKFKLRLRELRKKDLRNKNIEIEYKFNLLSNNKNVKLFDKIAMSKYARYLGITKNKQYTDDYEKNVYASNYSKDDFIEDDKLKNDTDEKKSNNTENINKNYDENINNVYNISNSAIDDKKKDEYINCEKVVNENVEKNYIYNFNKMYYIDDDFNNAEKKDNNKIIDRSKISKEEKIQEEVLRQIKKDKKIAKKNESREIKNKKREEKNKIKEENKRNKKIERDKQKEEERIEEELLVDNLYPKTKYNKDLQ